METEPEQLFESVIFSYIFLADFNSGLLLNALAVLVLLLFSGLLSGSEVAYFSLNHTDYENLKAEDTPASKRILHLLDRPRYLLSTILIANNVVNIAIILVSDAMVKQLVPPSLGEVLEFLITVVFVTFLLVLFGEVAPKVYANRNNLLIAKFMSRTLGVLGIFFRPISWFLVNSTKIIEQRISGRMNANSTVSQEDIDSAIELTVKDSKYAEQDMDILKGIVRFGNTAAAEIMKPRLKVVAMNIESSFDEVMRVFQEESFSRVPVYEENLDNIKGVLHAKDILELLENGLHDKWQDMIRKALFIPKEKKIDDLFRDFQVKRTHMAIVVNEYGGTEGLVTMEDILEEIVGDIQDEFDDQDDDSYDKVNDYTYDFEGSTSLSEICKILNVSTDFFDDKRDGAETIAGLVLVLSGKIPPANTAIQFKGHRIIILEATKRRIEKIRIVMPKHHPA